MSPELEELIQRGRRSLEQLEELKKSLAKTANDFRRVVRKLESLEPQNPADEGP